MNIERALKKFDEYYYVKQSPTMSFNVMSRELREILELMKDEPEDDKPDHWGYRVKIANLNKRLQRLESGKGELEWKVARLEEKCIDEYGKTIGKPSQPCPSVGESSERCEVTNVYKEHCTHCKPAPAEKEGETITIPREVAKKASDTYMWDDIIELIEVIRKSLAVERR
jgi:exonuclease VII small subunit